jgi:hypothetical protein
MRRLVLAVSLLGALGAGLPSTAIAQVPDRASFRQAPSTKIMASAETSVAAVKRDPNKSQEVVKYIQAVDVAALTEFLDRNGFSDAIKNYPVSITLCGKNASGRYRESGMVVRLHVLQPRVVLKRRDDERGPHHVCEPN